MLDQTDSRAPISSERWAVIDAWFDGVMKTQADLAEETAGWIPSDDDVQAVLIDRSSHVAVYVFQDDSRLVKSVPEFNDEPFVIPDPPRAPRPEPHRAQIEAMVNDLRAVLAGHIGIEDVWLAPDMSGVIFDFTAGTAELVPIDRFLALYPARVI